MKIARTFRPRRTAKKKFIAVVWSVKPQVSVVFYDVVQLRTDLVVTPVDMEHLAVSVRSVNDIAT